MTLASATLSRRYKSMSSPRSISSEAHIQRTWETNVTRPVMKSTLSMRNPTTQGKKTPRLTMMTKLTSLLKSINSTQQALTKTSLSTSSILSNQIPNAKTCFSPVPTGKQPSRFSQIPLVTCLKLMKNQFPWKSTLHKMICLLRDAKERQSSPVKAVKWLKIP